jgi:hypothetical protein
VIPDNDLLFMYRTNSDEIFVLEDDDKLRLMNLLLMIRKDGRRKTIN